jgi:peptidoglycan/LPS O-acetylase OafA/YrhL
VERPQRAGARVLSTRVLVAIGKRSYALYLWSYVLNTWLRDTGAFESFLVITTSFVAAEISYRFVELPVLRLKHHFATVDRRVPAVPDVGTAAAAAEDAGAGAATDAEIGTKVLISTR